MMSIEPKTPNNEQHNSPTKYSTIAHDKDNILLSNKGKARSSKIRSRICSLECVSPFMLSGGRPAEDSTTHGTPSPYLEATKFDHLKPIGDTSAVEENEDTSAAGKARFRSLMKGVFGDYLEEKLYDEEVKKSYLESSQSAPSYKATHVYLQAQTLYQPDVEKYKKDLRTFGDKKTIIIGLEDVLANISLAETRACDLTLSISQNSVPLATLYVKLRPYVLEFLDYLSTSFELIVFCSGSELYCSPVLDAIESKKKYFTYRLYGSHVLFENPKFSVKYYDFLMGKTRSARDTLIIDCDIGTFCLNLSNGIPISPFYGASGSDSDADVDSELVHLARYLESMRDAKDVSLIINNSFKRYLTADEDAKKKKQAACRIKSHVE